MGAEKKYYETDQRHCPECGETVTVRVEKWRLDNAAGEDQISGYEASMTCAPEQHYTNLG